jgi:hypothetical protein
MVTMMLLLLMLMLMLLMLMLMVEIWPGYPKEVRFSRKLADYAQIEGAQCS